MLDRSLFLAAVVLVTAGPAGAQDSEAPVIADRSDAAEIRVSLPRGIAAHPALRDEMEDRGRAALADFKAEAEAARLEAQGGAGYPWTPWSLDYVYEPRYLGPVYGSFLVNIIGYQGGAHPSLDYAAMTRDLELNEPVTLFDLFAGAESGSPALVAISDYVRAELARRKETRLGEPVDAGTADWAGAVAPRPENFELFTFEPAEQAGLIAGLSFHYPPYAVGPYSEGPYEIFVPAAVFADHLAGYFPTLFGGEPVEVTRLSSYEDPGTFVFLETPEPDLSARSPLEVAGEAPASWFEAGEVVLRVEDPDGRVLGEASAIADRSADTSAIAGDMTRFTASVSFAAGTQDGRLVIVPPRGAGPGVSAYLRF